jgi:hypothetical protein
MVDSSPSLSSAIVAQSMGTFCSRWKRSKNLEHLHVLSMEAFCVITLGRFTLYVTFPFCHRSIRWSVVPSSFR